MRSTTLRNTDLGMFSTRVKQSRIGSSPLRRCAPKAVPRLQLPTTTVVVP
jgi:hypothetical protein